MIPFETLGDASRFLFAALAQGMAAGAVAVALSWLSRR